MQLLVARDSEKPENQDADLYITQQKKSNFESISQNLFQNIAQSKKMREMQIVATCILLESDYNTLCLKATATHFA